MYSTDLLGARHPDTPDRADHHHFLLGYDHDIHIAAGAEARVTYASEKDDVRVEYSLCKAISHCMNLDLQLPGGSDDVRLHFLPHKVWK